MDEKLLKELEAELKLMKDLRDDYEAKGDGYRVVVESCDSMINHVKRAIARAYYPQEIKTLQESIYCICESMVSHGISNITADSLVAETVYAFFNKESELKR